MKKILVSLDELLDTRLGLVSIHNPQLAQEWVRPDNDVYFKRMHDKVIWEALGWTEERWYQVWDKRDVSVLKNSVVTHIPNVINEIIRLYRSSGEHGLDDLEVVLDVNLFPYVLDDGEIAMLDEILKEQMPIIERINFIRRNLKSMDHVFMKQYNYIILYPFNRWMYIHGKDLQNKLLPTIHIFAPRLLHIIPTDEELNSDPELKRLWQLDPFKLTESLAAPKLGITFIAASDFGPKITRPIHPDKKIEDLDHLVDQSGSYTLDSFLYDPQCQFPPQ